MCAAEFVRHDRNGRGRRAVSGACAAGWLPGRVQFGDRTKLIEYAKDHAPPDFLRSEIIDQTLEMNRNSGGYDLLEVNESSPLALKSWVRARASQEVVRLAIEVDAASPERIIMVAFLSEEPPERLRSRE